MTAIGEQMQAKGRYRAKCVGPATEEEGRRIVEYVARHPEMVPDENRRLPDGSFVPLDYSPNIEAANLLGIPLVEKWADEIENTVVNVGKNHMLDNDLQTSVSIVGPFMGLISSASYSAIAAADTMSSHAGWLEAGNANAPTYTSPRKTTVGNWNAASAGSKAMTAGLTFAITGTGTVKGAFLVYGTGAVSTIDNTAGTLFSAGLFSTGDRAVLSGDSLTISWSCSL